MKNIFGRLKFTESLGIFGLTLIAGAFLIDLIQGKNNGFGSLQMGSVGVGTFLVLLSWAAHNKKVLFYLGSILNVLTAVFFIFGAMLVLINVSGLFISLRKPTVNEGINFLGKFSKPVYSASDVVKLEDRRPDETMQDYVYRLTHLVNKATIQLPDERQKYPQFKLSVPIYENYFFWLFNYLDPQSYGYYQYCDSSKAIERAVTTCGQATRIIKDNLLKNGLKARRVTLDGHIIVEVQLDKKTRTWWVLDPLFDIVLEHDMTTLSKQPDLVADALKKAGYSDDVAVMYAAMFTPSGNYVITEENYCKVEQKYYFYKWAFPLLLLMPFGVGKIVLQKRVTKPS